MNEISKETEAFLQSISPAEKDRLYRHLWAEFVEQDVSRQLMEMGPILLKDDRESVISTVTRRFVYDGENDCNLPYWDNIQKLINMETLGMEEVSFTDKGEMIDYVTDRYNADEYGYYEEFLDFNVKMKKSDIVEAYKELQRKINDTDIFQTDENGNRMEEFDLPDEIYEGNCREFLENLGLSGHFFRTWDGNEVDFVRC